jgi:hypothetical protein
MSDRCIADDRCQAAVHLYDDDGKPLGRYGAVLPEGQRLCKWCTNHVGYALNSLPGDVGELSELLPLQGSTRLKDPEIPGAPRASGPRMPFSVRNIDLILLIDHKVRSWAHSTTSHLQMKWFTADELRRTRQLDDRVRRCCDLLRDHLATFVALPTVKHRARSRGVNRDEGYDWDTTTRFGDDVWCRQNGAQGALELLGLHEECQVICNRHAGDHVPLPCNKCHRRTLVRQHSDNKIVCQTCYFDQSDEDYETFLGAALTAWGVDTRGRGMH